MVGGANSAGQAAMYFARYASKVVLLVRGDSLASSMSRYLIDQIAATENIEVRTNTRVVEVHGETSLQALTLADSRTRDDGEGACNQPVHLYRRSAANRLAGGRGRARCERLHLGRSRSAA